MVALGIITIFLTCFTFIYYSYIANHSFEHDVSFFLSVSILSLLMNLCTNAAGFYGIAFFYLAIAVIFIGVGWAVDSEESLNFYKSIVPWFKKTFADLKLLGWQVLSTLLFPAGIVLYFVWYKPQNGTAKVCGRCALFGLVLWGILLWMILGIVL